MIRALLIVLSVYGLASAGDEPPVIPVGLDAYRQWERWPVQRIGARAYMRSTYDRRGGNEGADASHFLYQLADDRNVTLDVAGPGILYFARYNHWHGSPWHYVVDGVDHVITETSTKDPLHPTTRSVFEPADALPNPLTWTWSHTRGADLMWMPIGFERSFQMQYERTRYGTGYYIFHQYVPGAKLSQPIRAWDSKSPPDDDVLRLIRDGPNVVGSRTQSGDTRVIELTGGPRVIASLKLSVPVKNAVELENAHLRVWFDDRSQPSVDAPLALFFGAGTFYNRESKEFLVNAFPVTVRLVDQNYELTCRFPMPYFHSAKIELPAELPWTLSDRELTDPPNHVGYFHATYRDHSEPEAGKDLILLDTRSTEGGGDWSGSFIGTSFIFSHNANLTTLEGDPRFFFDDSQTPQGQGTGTEEWGGGGDYWGGRNMTLPFAGHPCGAPSIKEAKDERDKIESAYRFLLADLFPFGRNARICLEHGGTNESKEHYESVTYWYGLPGASLIQTDLFQIGDAVSEAAHSYQSPDASPPYEINSRYEWGVDHVGDREIYPAHVDTGRVTTGTSEFTIKLNPDNFGVLLRRKLDYSFPNQRAEVFVDSKPAGTWYLAGSNTCVYSNPKDELGATQHTVQTSNRRFRDDEFLIGRDLARGKDSIRVRIKFVPVETPLFPGAKLPQLGWSEIRYDAYCFVMPPMPK